MITYPQLQDARRQLSEDGFARLIRHLSYGQCAQICGQQNITLVLDDPRNTLRHHFGIPTVGTFRDPLTNEVLSTATTPTVLPVPTAIVDLNGNDVNPEYLNTSIVNGLTDEAVTFYCDLCGIMKDPDPQIRRDQLIRYLSDNPTVQVEIRPLPVKKPALWGSAHSDAQIHEIIGLKDHPQIHEAVQKLLISMFRQVAHESGPTAWNMSLIKAMIRNELANRLLNPGTRMVRDMDIVASLQALCMQSRPVAERFPTNNFVLSTRYIFKKGNDPINIQALDTDRATGTRITAQSPGWSQVNTALHHIPFMYKPDPTVEPIETLKLRKQSMDLSVNEYVHNPNVAGGQGLSRIHRVDIDEFNGHLIAETNEGPVVLHHPAMVYQPLFKSNDRVKVVRSKELRRKHMPTAKGWILNRAMVVDRLRLFSDGRIAYDVGLYRWNKTRQRDEAVNNMRGIAQDLLIPAKRTKAFGSL